MPTASPTAAPVASVASRSSRRTASVTCTRAGSVRRAIASVARSIAIAMITIATPARIARAGLVLRPFVTRLPRPWPVLISPAITTIESANRIVWLTARSSIFRASGSCTLSRSCRRVAPSDAAASTVFAGTPRTPRAVIRTAGGTE